MAPASHMRAAPGSSLNANKTYLRRDSSNKNSGSKANPSHANWSAGSSEAARAPDAAPSAPATTMATDLRKIVDLAMGDTLLSNGCLCAVEGLDLGFVATGFDAVPVRTNDESCMVVRVAMRAQTRRAIVLAIRIQTRGLNGAPPLESRDIAWRGVRRRAPRQAAKVAGDSRLNL